ncbi:MAG: 2,3-diketo-5-methylthiopentyl-1-phosphate enolase [Bacilli bacterium]
MGNVVATYLIHDPKDNLEKKAEGIALGLTIGSWTDLPDLDKKQLEKHKGTVVGIESLHEEDKVNQYLGGKITRGIVKISYPSVNFSNDLPAILTTVFGKLSLNGEVKLVDLDFSTDLVAHFPGPKFGIEGIREQLGVTDRPLLMSIFKGVLGRDSNNLKNQLKEQIRGGVDIVKDDEILFDNPLTPFEQRIRAGVETIDEVFAETRNRSLYAVNLSGRSSLLIEKAKRAVELGASALLFNVFAYGLDTLQSLAEDPDITVPIMAHPALSGAIIPSQFYGISSPLLLGKLLRMVGADFVLFPSPYGSVAMERKQTLAIASELTKELDGMKRAFPVPSAGIHPGLTPKLIEDFGTDCIINAGGGIHGHPSGTAAGGKAFRDAIDGLSQGKTLQQISEKSDVLKQALALWG